MPKDDMSIQSRIPEKAIKQALAQLRLDPELADVEWNMPRGKPPRPTKVYFEAADIADLRKAKDRLGELLSAAGYELYP